MCIRDSFESIDEGEYAIAARKIVYHDWIRLHNPDYGKKPSEVVYGDVTKKVIITTAGRVRFNEIWPYSFCRWHRRAKKVWKGGADYGTDPALRSEDLSPRGQQR